MQRSLPSRALSAAATATLAWLALGAVGEPARALGTTRLALLVGNNHGGKDTRPLLYATEDARRIHGVLTELGGVRPEDATLLLNRGAPEVLRALDELERKAAAARQRGERVALILYYSGHAKDGALQLGDSRLPLELVKARLGQGAQADVRIGIFDSCRSGEARRTKGVRRQPAFDVEASSEEARGVVFLSSSNADEDAQESDAIGGSYFSHHLASGLRGDADRSGDRRVTLSEAYAYAYAATVADTAESSVGAQHPTFSYDLKGNGDLILTDITSRREGLEVPAAAPPGTYYLVKQGLIAAEIRKGAEERRIALAPGKYLVKRRLPDRLRTGEIRVAAGTWARLEEARLRDTPFSDDPVKGARRDLRSRYAIALAASSQRFFDESSRQGLFPPTGLVGAELQVRDFFRRGWVLALDLVFGGARATLVRPSGELPFRFGEAALGTSLYSEWSFADGHLLPFFGGRVAFLTMERTFEGTSVPEQSMSTFSPGVLGGVRYRFGSGLSALLLLRLHYFKYNIEDNRSLGFSEIGAALSYEL